MDLMRTLRYALRQLLATPGFTAIAVLIAAIGIGASTAMFSTVHAVVLKPLSLPEPDRLVTVYETNLERNVPFFSVSVPNYVDFKARATSFAAMAAVTWRAMNLTGRGDPQLIQVRTVTANFLDTLGVRMAQGRDFTADEDRPNGPKVAVISDGFWRRHFGGRPDVVGQTLQLDGEAYAIVGVTAVGLPLPGDIEVAVPMQADVATEDRLNHELDVFARLAPGVSIEAADRELQAIAAQIATSMPAGERGWRTRLVPLVEDIVGDRLRRTLLVLLGAVGLLLLVACANLSNLLLVRATGRGFDLAVRRALGESRGRAIAQLLVESLVVTALGGALGILLASWSVEALRTLPIPRMAEIAVDPRVLAVAIAATLISGILAGVGPAIRASQVAPQDALQSQAVRLAPRSRLRDGMIVAQLGLSLTLLVGAALVARSFWGLLSVDPGFSVDHAVTLAMRPSMEAEPFYEAVGARVRALPGVESAGFISTLPLGPGGNTSNNVFAAGPSQLAAGQSIQASWRLVDGGYFEAMRIPLLRGRTFDGLTPDEARRSIVLSASLARALFGDDDPVGREVDPGGNNAAAARHRRRRRRAEPPARRRSAAGLLLVVPPLHLRADAAGREEPASDGADRRGGAPRGARRRSGGADLPGVDTRRGPGREPERGAPAARHAVGLRRRRPAARRTRHLRRRRLRRAAADPRVRHPPRGRCGRKGRLAAGRRAGGAPDRGRRRHRPRRCPGGEPPGRHPALRRHAVRRHQLRRRHRGAGVRGVPRGLAARPARRPGQPARGAHDHERPGLMAAPRRGRRAGSATLPSGAISNGS